MPGAGQQRVFVEAYLGGLLAGLGLDPPAGAAAAAAADGLGEGLSIAAAAASGGGGAALRSVWGWLRLHGVERPADAGRGAVSPAAWRSLVAALQAAARAYECTSHLVWALWGLVQARDSACPDFDYMSYAQQRWERYRATRPAELAGG
ncbi:hypothetical protein MNEG_2830 [Monoraphidium neglectum]|uniref:Uncharacterized protein n=1 Tax=Monoraphidium neglectum TaxID=145388 RepID=A0A0D2LEL7_9CHLO|nr:hypothetical protein MNEG_2830 [Monoraphidium neglectum]KIZ05119.1 hypothetical protein MNEG_2830 [Monoraphidium neglectum]|eukprot:XP_013904138.1 hypothetical protein MNEG_2830 [Monoraphidium neglectum]